jgi:hypothetical protein
VGENAKAFRADFSLENHFRDDRRGFSAIGIIRVDEEKITTVS